MTARYHPNGIVKIHPATGEAAFQFTIEALEALEQRIGGDWYDVIIQRLQRGDVKILRTCARYTLRDTDMSVTEILKAAPLNIIAERMLDALLILLHGKTFAQMLRQR